MSPPAGQRLHYKNYTTVFGNEAMREMSDRLPVTLSELRAVAGVSDFKLEKYGVEFCDVTAKYAVMVVSECHPTRDHPRAGGGCLGGLAATLVAYSVLVKLFRKTTMLF